MARISDVVRLGNRRPARPVDGDTRELAARRQVQAGTMLPAHYQPDAPEFGGRDLTPGVAVDAAVEGSSLNGGPLMAAVVPAAEYMRQARSAWKFTSKRVNEVQPWEKDVFRMMRFGPGFVGTAASMYADWMAGSARLVVQERSGRDASGQERWEETGYEPAREILRMWRGDELTQQDLIRRALTYFDSVGQCYQCLRKGEGGRWVVDLWAHTAVSFDADKRRVIARGIEGASEDDPLWYREYLPTLVDHLFLSDLEWQGRPTSQMQRVMTDIYRLVLAERSVDRDLVSRLASNGVLHIPASPGAKDWTADYAEWASRAYSGTFDENYVPGLSSGLEEVAPFLMQSVGKPEFVEIGRDLGKAMSAREMAWEAIRVGLDMPKQALDGNEAASRWTGFLNRDEDALKAAAPRMQRLAAMVERSHWRPWARMLGFAKPLDQFRVWYELPDVRPERTSEKLTIAPTLVPTRAAIAETDGWSPADLAALPQGMTEFEAAFLLKHGKPLDQVLAQADQAESAADAADAAQNVPGSGRGEAPPTSTVAQPPRLAPGVREPREPVMPTANEMPMAAALPSELDTWEAMVPR